jgi:ATP-GRASP peptide maturase of grasp-with-spasm system
MIFVLSSFAEEAVNNVMSWFLFKQQEVLRITEEKKAVFLIKMEGAGTQVTINGIKIKNVSSLWVRKGYFHYQIKCAEILNDPQNHLEKYFHHEFSISTDFLIHQLEQKLHIGNYFQRVPNKLWHLEIARQAGLNVPNMIVTTKKSEAREFVQKYGAVINKSIKDSFTGTFEGVYYYNHTERVSIEVVEELDEEFFPTLFQEEIPKGYELRVIFVHEKMWAGAIMSQSDPKTSLDWRNYNHQKSNRIVPYKLPSEVEEKIRKFAQLADLNTGAIDMIVSKDKRYVFLECNPNGQISMVSEKCNYPIEKYIADFLANA